ncbi:putative WEB family protein At1g65010, chloroplastic [Cucumis sativus]|uniref:putative WEB family protein At1g65010, chloroplastic n=1 Tax=Cucumis sativus TaxID=3659 RepID=UPI0012F480ED|nr:putative WEB family protein At1g65010, chloroplastic [Cucumis sativus]
MANEINTKLNSELESRNKESAVGKAEGLESVKRNKNSAVEKAEGLKSVKRNKDSAVENAEGLKLQLAEKQSSSLKPRIRKPKIRARIDETKSGSAKNELKGIKAKKGRNRELETTLKTIEEKNKTLLQEARKEADLYKSTVDRLRLEAEESLLAWSGRETSLVDCIRRAEDDRYNAQQESPLNGFAEASRSQNMTSKEEIKKLRDILKQALNEATVAKEAAGIAIEENSQLKDCLVEKENALDFVSTENETLKVSQASALEEIKELKQLLEEATKKEGNGKEESKSKEENKSKEESKNKEEGKEQVEMTKSKPPLSPSPNQNPSPSPARRRIHLEKAARERPSLSQYSEDGELMHFDGEDLDQLEEGNLDELEGDRNSRKKKALIRRFGIF